MFGKLARLFGMLEKASTPTITCDTCGKRKKGQFWTNDELPGKQFCTKKCVNLYGEAEYTCTQCGGDFIGGGLEMKDDPNMRFCSNDCGVDYFMEHPEKSTNKSKTIATKCDACGNHLKVANFFENKLDYPGKKFCTKRCANRYESKLKELL